MSVRSLTLPSLHFLGAEVPSEDIRKIVCLLNSQFLGLFFAPCKPNSFFKSIISIGIILVVIVDSAMVIIVMTIIIERLFVIV